MYLASCVKKKLYKKNAAHSEAECCRSHLITVPLAPPAVVSMTLVVRLTRKSSCSKPSSSAQHCSVWLD